MPGSAGHAASAGSWAVDGRVQTAAWAVFALVDALSLLTVYASPGAALVMALVLAPLIVLLAAALRAGFARLGLPDRISLPVLGWVVGPSLAAASVVVAAGAALRAMLGLDLDAGSRFGGAMLSLVYYFMIFTIWSLACFWTTAEGARRAAQRRAAEAEAQQLRTEVQRLRLQLNPHFVLNALNAIGEEIPEHPDAALAMLRDLAVFLRQTLAGVDLTIVTVGAEAEALASYLRVQEARFGPRLRVRLEIDAAAAARSIPSFLLQPLVENAIEHGQRAPSLEVVVALRAEGEGLEVCVTNTGRLGDPGGGTKARGRGGVGLANLRRRLALHYPGRHRFELSQREGMVLARLVLAGKPCAAA